MVNRNIKGIGLLELVLALAIIGVMLVSATRYFSVVNRSHRLEQAIEMVSAIKAAGERWKVAKDNYSTLSKMSDFVDRGFLPSIYGASGTSAIKNPWGGEVTVAKGTDSTLLDITFTKVPTEECSVFVDRIPAMGCDASSSKCSDNTAVATC